MLNKMNYLASVTESDPDGRVKVQFKEHSEMTTDWILVMQGVHGSGEEGLHTQLGIGDIVLINFFDYPENQQPFVLGKFQTSNDRIAVDSKTTFYYNEHEINFNSDNVEIKSKDGSFIKIEADKITLEKGSGAYNKIMFGNVDLINWLKTHVHVGNLGFPTAVPTQATLLIPGDKLSVES